MEYMKDVESYLQSMNKYSGISIDSVQYPLHDLNQ